MVRKLKLKPPTMPNFIIVEMPAGRREDGFNQLPSFPITDFTSEEAEEYGELMKQTFIKHYNEKVRNGI